jgi:hypothetical protein
MGEKFATVSTKQAVVHRKVPAGTRILCSSLWEPSTLEVFDCGPTVALFTTKAKANDDARKKLQYSVSVSREMIWECDDLSGEFPAVPAGELKPTDFPATRRTTVFGQTQIDQRYTEFTHSNGLFGGLIRNHCGFDEMCAEVDQAFWVAELKIDGKVSPSTLNPEPEPKHRRLDPDVGVDVDPVPVQRIRHRILSRIVARNEQGDDD